MNTYKSKNSKYLSKYGEFASGYFEDKKSKFYCYLFDINSDQDAVKYINNIKKSNKDARHIIYIYSYIENSNISIKFSDDGEPQGTGTRAIYDMMMRDHITNICVAIVRYFGGVLLGAGPLSRAYLNSFRDSINECEVKGILMYDEYTFDINYSNIEKFKNLLNKYEEDSLVIIDNIIYNTNITVKIRIEKNIRERVLNLINEFII